MNKWIELTHEEVKIHEQILRDMDVLSEEEFNKKYNPVNPESNGQVGKIGGSTMKQMEVKVPTNVEEAKKLGLNVVKSVDGFAHRIAKAAATVIIRDVMPKIKEIANHKEVK